MTTTVLSFTRAQKMVSHTVMHYRISNALQNRPVGYSFGHNSPVTRAREMFKPSTDSASLLVKNCFITTLQIAVIPSRIVAQLMI